MKKSLIISLLVAVTQLCLAQKSNIEEDIYVHLSSHELIVGEMLNFSVFVNSKLTNKPSMLSKIAYVEIFNAHGKSVYQGKIIITNGRGQGAYFVNSTLSTGSYRFVCHTRWMRNFNRYFEDRVVIVNPFEQSKNESSKAGKNSTIFSFHTGNHQAIASLPLQVHYAIESATAHSIVQGRVIDTNGEVVGQFDPAQTPTGSFVVTPQLPGKYKITLESENGQFLFYDLSVKSGHGESLIVKNNAELIEISAHSTDENFTGILSIDEDTDTSIEFDVINHMKLAVAKRRLTPGLHDIVLKNIDGRHLIKRMIYIPFSETDKPMDQTYGRRSEVNVKFDLDPGTYAVQVKKNRDWFNILNLNPIFYTSLSGKLRKPSALLSLTKATDLIDDRNMNYLLSSLPEPQMQGWDTINMTPEHRGELISGRLVSVNDSIAQPATLLLAIHGKTLIATAQTNTKGNFFFTVPPLSEEATAFVQSHDHQPIAVHFDSPFINQLDSIKQSDLTISEETWEELSTTSVRNQIENAYYSIKKNEVHDAILWYNSFHTFDEVFVLDAFNRFSTMAETIIEIIPSIDHSRSKDGESLRVRFGSGVRQSDAPPLIMLDGVPISIADALKVKTNGVYSISVITKKLYAGTHHFNGVIAIRTFENNIDLLQDHNNTKASIKIIAPQKRVEYNATSAVNVTSKRTPDFRELLYWEPEFKFEEKGTANIRFYTSDIDGEFEVSISGFTNEGKPVYHEKAISVTPQTN